VRRQEIAPARDAGASGSELGDVGVGQVGGQVVKAADPGAIRNGFDIEGEDWRHLREIGVRARFPIAIAEIPEIGL